MKKSIVTSYHSVGFTHFEYLAFIKSNFISVMLVNNILIRMTIKTFFIHESFCIWIDILSKTNQNINAAHSFILSVLTEKWDLRLREACPGLLYTPPSLDSTPMSKHCQREMRRNMKRKGQNGIASSNFFCNSLFLFAKHIFLNVTWDTAKYGDPYTEFVLCIYPSKVHTHSSEHTHTHTHTHTRNSTLFCLNTLIFSCKTLFSFAILQFSCKYTRHCFDSILNPPISTTKPTHLHPLDVDPTPPPGSLFCSEGLLKFFCARSLTVPV